MAVRLSQTRPQTFDASDVFKPRIHVTREFLPIAIKHGCELWWDGSTPTKRLDTRSGNGFTRYVNARIEGKLAEVAFSLFLKEYFGIESQVDWRIYGDYETTDDGDLQYLVGDDGEHYPLSAEVDVKKTKPWNQWLAIRRESFDHIEDDAPVVLTKLSLKDDIEVDEWEDVDDWDVVDQDERFRGRLLEFADQYFPLSVEIVGTAYPDEFTDEFRAGERLYDPRNGDSVGGPLKRDNVGIHVSDLIATAPRWNRVVMDLVGPSPVSINPLPVLDGFGP